MEIVLGVLHILAFNPFQIFSTVGAKICTNKLALERGPLGLWFQTLTNRYGSRFQLFSLNQAIITVDIEAVSESTLVSPFLREVKRINPLKVTTSSQQGRPR